jgi:hypothetical protein
MPGFKWPDDPQMRNDGPGSPSYTFTRETALACKELVNIQTEMLTCIDPQMRGRQLDVAAAQADASVARINELEQQLKAAKVVASDARGDKLIELLTSIDARLNAIENKPSSCCVIS